MSIPLKGRQLSLTLSTNSRSLDSLKVSVRCGCKPNAFHIRRTVVCDWPAAAAIERIDQWVASAGKGYVLGVKSDHHFGSWGSEPPVAGKAEEIAQDLDPGAWKRLSAGQGTKGARLHDWANLAFFTTWCPAGTGIQALVAVEGRRWAIEDSFEITKNELGLDHNETRSWHGWHRDVSLVMLCFRHDGSDPIPRQ